MYYFCKFVAMRPFIFIMTLTLLSACTEYATVIKKGTLDQKYAMAMEKYKKKDYVRDIIENPPAVIAYTTLWSDMDVKKFEAEVINISKIINNCYIQDSPDRVIDIPKTKNVLYIPKIKHNNELKNCIKLNSI